MINNNRKPTINNDRAYINQIPMRHGEVTIVTSASAEASMVHSVRLGAEAERAGLPTLIVNCALSPKRFKEHFNANHQPKAKPDLFVHSSVKGNLAGESEAIDQMVYEGKVGLVIIVGWEWTASSWRRKQRLLHYLRELMATRDVAVVVYSHCHNNPKPGHVDKGGVGKLALVAMFVAELGMSDELEASCPKPPPLVFKDIAEQQAAERSARELISKINGLGERSERVSGSGVRVSEEGEKGQAQPYPLNDDDDWSDAGEMSSRTTVRDLEQA